MGEGNTYGGIPVDPPRTLDSIPPAQDAEGRYVPPPIKGYRKLTQAELDAVNAVKEHGAVLERAMKAIEDQNIAAGCGPLDPRALALAKTNLQQGLMWLTRSITKPGTFA